MKKILNRCKLEQEDSNEAGVFILNFYKSLNRKSKSEYHTIKISCDFMEGSSRLYVTILQGLVAIDIVVVECMTACSKGCVTLWVEASHSKLPPFQVF